MPMGDRAFAAVSAPLDIAKDRATTAKQTVDGDQRPADLPDEEARAIVFNLDHRHSMG